MPFVGLYQVCSNLDESVIYIDFVNFFFFLKTSSSLKRLMKLLSILVSKYLGWPSTFVSQTVELSGPRPMF